MSRNDAHSPANLVTENYEYVFAADNQSTWRRPFAETEEGIEFLLSLGRYDPATAERDCGQCHHCGAHIRYVAWLRHLPTGYMICVGETCLENRFDRATADFHRLRKQAQLDRQAQRIRKAVAEFAEQNPDLAFLANRDEEVYNDQCPVLSRENYWLKELSRKLNYYGSLFDNQIESARKSIIKDAEIAAQRAAEALEPKVDVIEGKVTIQGTVLGLKPHYNDFGSTLKMTVKDERGFKVWGTVPSSLDDINRGDVVRFNATVTVSDSDSTFGFFKRPTQASFITRKEEEEA